jgi:hypothetical protein
MVTEIAKDVYSQDCIAFRLDLRNEIERLKIAVGCFEVPTSVEGGMSCGTECEVWEKRAVNPEGYQGKKESVLASVDRDALALEIELLFEGLLES